PRRSSPSRCNRSQIALIATPEHPGALRSASPGASPEGVAGTRRAAPTPKAHAGDGGIGAGLHRGVSRASATLGPMDHVEEPEAVLLVVEEVVADDAKGRRDRDHQAILPVPDLADAEAVDGLRTAMGFPGAPDDPAASRYHRVCIVAFPASPVRSWVAAF